MSLGQKIRKALDAAKQRGEVAAVMLAPIDWYRYRKECADADKREPEDIERLVIDGIPIVPSDTVKTGHPYAA